MASSVVGLLVPKWHFPGVGWVCEGAACYDSIRSALLEGAALSCVELLFDFLPP